MEGVIALCDLLLLLLQQADAELGQHLRDSGCQGIFMVPWWLTWFAHDLKRWRTVARLYDFFLCSHPLAPLYCAAAVRAAPAQ